MYNFHGARLHLSRALRLFITYLFISFCIIVLPYIYNPRRLRNVLRQLCGYILFPIMEFF